MALSESDILEKFNHVTATSGGWSARCPAHEDHTASLSISQGKESRWLLHCHAGCSLDAILRSVGVEAEDLYHNEPRQKTKVETDVYDYVDIDGKLRYQVVRYFPKTFRQRRPDGAGGFVWSLKGVDRVLYRLPGIIEGRSRAFFDSSGESKDGTHRVYVVEGEKDADRLTSLAVMATTCCGGAESWSDVYAEQLAAAGVQSIVILPDNDVPGHTHAQRVAQSCRHVFDDKAPELGADIKVVPLPGLKPKGDVSDWLDAGHSIDELETVCAEYVPDEDANPITAAIEAEDAGVKTTFEHVGESRYRLTVDCYSIVFEVDRLRREKQSLHGEVSVTCDTSIASTYGGKLLTGDMNLSSMVTRPRMSKLINERASVPDLPWEAWMEEFCQSVILADRSGEDSQTLRDVELGDDDDVFEIEGVQLLKDHPVIMFGDGGSAKSLTALYLAGRLEQCGIKVLYIDWEFSAADHRRRLGKLFPEGMPSLEYMRCDRPLAVQIDQIRRVVDQKEIDYVICDSIAFACTGPPESAEIAAEYYRAVRQLGVGSLHLAHVTKGEHSDKRPFGSAFWHNGARHTYYTRATDERPLCVGLFDRKHNCGPKRDPRGFRIMFSSTEITYTPIEVTDVEEFVSEVSIPDRVRKFCESRNAQTIAEISIGTELTVDEVEHAVKRSRLLVEVNGNADGVTRYGTAERRY